MSRVYTLELLGISLLLSSDEFNWKSSIALFIIAQTTILGTIISLSVFIYFFFTSTINGNNYHKFSFPLIGVVIALWNSLAGTIEWGHFETVSQQVIDYDLVWFAKQISTIYKGFIPLPNFLETHFWNTNIVDSLNIEYLKIHFKYFNLLEHWLFEKRKLQIDFIKNILLILLSVSVILGIYFSFHKDKKIVFLYFLGAIPMFILFAFIFHGSVRHHGHFFLLYLICYWFLIKRGNQTTFSKTFLTLILAVQLPGGFYAYYMDWNYDFSGSQKVAKYIKSNFNKENTLITGAYDYTLAPISYYLATDIYNFQNNQLNSFVKWGKEKPYYKYEIFKRIDSLSKATNKDVLIVLSKRLPFEPIEACLPLEYQNDFIEKFCRIDIPQHAIVEDENYSLFYFSNHKKGCDNPAVKSISAPIEALKNSKNILYNIDLFINEDNVFCIKGWAFLQNKEPELKKNVVLENEKGEVFYLSSTSIERRDVLANTKNIHQLYSGFKASCNTLHLNEGTYKVYIEIVTNTESYTRNIYDQIKIKH